MNLELILNFFLNLIKDLGYFGVFFGTFVESIFPPIPSELIMGTAGLLVQQGKFNFILVVISALFGNLCSSALIWYLGHKFGQRFLLRYGKWIGFEKEDLEKSEQLFQKYGYTAIAVCQLIPGERSLISLPAGVLKTKLLPFLVATSIGAAIWLSILTYLGYLAGENWQIIEEWVKPYSNILFIIFMIAAVGLIAKYIYEKRGLLLKR